MVDVTHLTAAGLARRIRDGDLSPVEVVEAHLDRIAECNDRTNAFVTVAEDRAREAARDAERARETGEPTGPLHGVPVAIKDLDNVAGVATTFGSKLFEDFVADESDPFVERLEAAGAVVVGKTNTPEFGLGTTTDNLVVGPTGTPFDPDRTAGGSSGGTGAALADRLVPIGSGSDTGGSIRIPASCCGVYGIKPSFGRVPRPSRPDGFAHHTPFSCHGPLARTVEDAALMLDAMAGPHPADPFTLPDDDTAYVEATDRPVDDLRIGYSVGMDTYAVDPSVRSVIDEAIGAFEDAGATVEPVEVDLGCTDREVLDAFYTFAKVRWEALFDGLEAVHGLDPRGADRDRLRPVVVETILEADEVTTREYKRADVVRTRVYDGLRSILSDYDLLASATLAVPPFPIGDPPTSVDGREIEPLRGWVLCQPFNFSGHPAASIPAGLTDDGLPVGLQLAGRRFADDDVLAASAAFERVRPWRNAYPE